VPGLTLTRPKTLKLPGMILHLRCSQKAFAKSVPACSHAPAPGDVICVTAGGANPPKVYLMFPSLVVLPFGKPLCRVPTIVGVHRPICLRCPVVAPVKQSGADARIVAAN
jgi:hypothetical protein